MFFFWFNTVRNKSLFSLNISRNRMYILNSCKMMSIETLDISIDEHLGIFVFVYKVNESSLNK